MQRRVVGRVEYALTELRGSKACVFVDFAVNGTV